MLTFADLPALEEEGREYRVAHPTALADAVASIDEEDLFTFIYTSGTTGPPKGCMIRTATTTRWSRRSTTCPTTARPAT